MIVNVVGIDFEMFMNKLFEEYDDLFYGIGKMEGVKVDFYVDCVVILVV